MGGPSEESASKKMISILFFSISQAARKTLLDNFPATKIAPVTLPVLLDQWKQTFVKQNGTLDGIRLFPRDKENKEAL